MARVVKYGMHVYIYVHVHAATLTGPTCHTNSTANSEYGLKTKKCLNKPGGDRVHVCVMGWK
jgi:hypothetical protein